MLKELVPKNWIISTKIHKLIENLILELLCNHKNNLMTFDYNIAFTDYSTQLKTLQLV